MIRSSLRHKTGLVVAALLASAAMATSASAAELVTNGGFETGDFTGWTQGGNTGFTGVGTSNVNSGTYSAFFGPVGSTGTLSQLLNTVAGDSYTISFALKTSSGVPNYFSASFDGSPLFSFANLNVALPYATYSFVTTALNSGSTLSFAFRQDPSYFYLDDVSVTGTAASVPEPATWALMIGGFGLVGGAMRIRSRKVNFVSA